jgi:hypothetical protein
MIFSFSVNLPSKYSNRNIRIVPSLLLVTVASCSTLSLLFLCRYPVIIIDKMKLYHNKYYFKDQYVKNIGKE